MVNANMRTAYSASAVHSANRENPTQNTPRQPRCMAMNGTTRNQSMRSSSASGRFWIAAESNQRAIATSRPPMAGASLVAPA